MSLTDLKRRKKKSPRDSISVDDFIEDANNYAFGQQSAVSRNKKKLKQAQLNGLDKHSTKIFKHATFSLTEDAIIVLDDLATQSKIAKSRLLRILIHDFFDKCDTEKRQIISNSED
ncbi:replication protein RepA [Shewanella hanedai]|uniref:Replication protein RepA n=1 Tax=Shewanella hanedai TaxID=25 RepID=A0A553JJ05_SHEHA|nr:replication protein RepA [Shewanella hanedai]TRY12442.1 replication protein RepA [Shewanella hanedai]GGI96754.1 replication protein RepA [Shewanella hanedai]